MNAPCTLEERCRVLGADLITPDEISRLSDFKYSSYERDGFWHLLTSIEANAEFRGNTYALLPPPPTKSVSLDYIRHRMAWAFDGACNWWMGDDAQVFARCEPAMGRLLLIRNEALPDSFDKTWTEQCPLVEPGFLVPTVTQVAWMIAVYRLVRNRWLLREYTVRTSSVSDDGFRVGIGTIEGGKIRLTKWWDDSRNARLGLLSQKRTG